MNFKIKTFKLLQICLLFLGLMAITVNCSDDDILSNPQNGYVQFKLYKSASYDKRMATRAGGNQLDYLNEATKIKVILNNQDNLQFVAALQ